MRVSSLKLNFFRNFEKAAFTFGGEKTVVCGDNARGKSNLLEAIYFLAVAKSGRGTKDRDVLQWGASYFSIDAVVEREDRPLSIRIAYDPRVGKKVHLDENPLPRLSALIGAFNAVLFSPEDVDLVLRDPQQRRRILDILVSQSNASYLADLELYRRVLSHRNRLLKDRGARLLSDPAQLSPWDAQFAELGGRIIRHRLEALDEIGPMIERYYREIAPTTERLQADYRSQVPPSKRDCGEEILAAALQRRRAEEVALGFTLIGPHRDNLIFLLDGRRAHEFASKGQLKSVLLAWKMGEANYLEARTGQQPVLLMDDIFSELDSKRAFSLLDLATSFGQVVLTSVRDPDLALDRRGVHLIRL